MDEYRRQVSSRWFRALRGPMTQEAFLADLERVTGWALHRPNLSRYENGKALPEPETWARLVAYAETRGIEPPNFTPPEAVPSYEERTLDALNRQTTAMEQLVARIDRLVSTRDRDLEELARTLATLLASPATRQGVDVSPDAPAAPSRPGRGQ